MAKPEQILIIEPQYELKFRGNNAFHLFGLCYVRFYIFNLLCNIIISYMFSKHIHALEFFLNLQSIYPIPSKVDRNIRSNEYESEKPPDHTPLEVNISSSETFLRSCWNTKFIRFRVAVEKYFPTRTVTVEKFISKSN